MKEIICAENIIKSYGISAEKRSILDGVSLSIQEGESVSIMGPSGSGKSTLLFALSGMDPVDSGTVSFCGHDLSACRDQELSDLRRTRMGFVFQQPTLLKNLTLFDNILLPAMRDHRHQGTALAQKARRLMEKTGIKGLENRDITQVSGGQLQRAGICRALMNDPDVLFADEPTGALNSKSAKEIMDIFSDVNAQGTTLLLVTHDPVIAARSERILFINDGKIVQEIRLPKDTKTGFDGRIEKIMRTSRSLGI